MEPALIWNVEMIVTVVLYLQNFVDGEPQHTEVARLVYNSPAVSMGLCSWLLEDRKHEIALQLAQSLRDFWSTELQVRSFDLVFESRGRCRPFLEPPS